MLLLRKKEQMNFTFFPNEKKNEQFGMSLLSDVKNVMNAAPCNKVKITMVIEPIKDEE